MKKLGCAKNHEIEFLNKLAELLTKHIKKTNSDFINKNFFAYNENVISEENVKEFYKGKDVYNTKPIIYFIDNLMSKPGDFNDYENSKKTTFCFKNLISYLYNKPFNDKDIFNQTKSLFDELSKWYNSLNPYPEINIKDIFCLDEEFLNDSNDSKDELFKSYNNAIGFILLFLIVYLHHNPIVSGNETITNVNKDEFEKTINKHKRIIFKGDFRCGKTKFLRQYADNNHNFVFYHDAKFNTIKKSDVLNTFRTDIAFWQNNAAIQYFKNNFFCFLIPECSNDNGKEQDYYKKHFSLISNDKILIIDHISDKELEIINDLKDLKCTIIFVPEFGSDYSRYDITEYYYDNTDVLKKLIRQSYLDISNIEFDKLRIGLGSDVFLYYAIQKADEQQKIKKDNFNLINELIKAESFNDYLNILSNCNIKFTLRYPKSFDTSTGLYLESHIAKIYEEWFGTIEYKNAPENNRIKPIQQHLLRLLCRLNDKNVSYQEIKEFIDFEEIPKNVQDDIYYKLEKIGWVKNNKLCIPYLVACAFNQSVPFTQEQYKEESTIQFAIVEQIKYKYGSSQKYELFCAILKSFIEDIEYFEKKNQKFIKKYRDLYIEDNNLYFESSCKTKNSKVKKSRNYTIKQTDEAIALHRQDSVFLLETILEFSLRHNNNELWDTAVKRLQIINNSNYKIHVLELAKSFDFPNKTWNSNTAELFKENNYYKDFSSLMFLFEVNIEAINKMIFSLLNYLTNNPKQPNLVINTYMHDISCVLFNEINILNSFENYSDTETKTINTLYFYYNLTFRIYSQMYYWAYLDNESLTPLITNCLQYNIKYSRIYETLLMLSCLEIIIPLVTNENNENNEIKQLISQRTKLYTSLKDEAGALSATISEIVKLTENFLQDRKIPILNVDAN